MKVPLFKPWFESHEEQPILEDMKGSLRSGWLCLGGPHIDAFEKEFAALIGAKHAIAVNNGSSALLIMQAAFDIGPGDEVLVPDMTFISTASSTLYLGAKPIFVDISLKNYCVDPKDLAKKITPKTKAIIPVHMAGHTADMDEILTLAKKHNIPVIEDAAQAHLSKYKGKNAGILGDIAMFSLTPSKLMTTGEGGIITTNSDALAEKCKLLRNFYEDPHVKFKYFGLGFNFRMTEFAAIIGRHQLKKLPRAVKNRRRIAQKYTQSFADLPGVITPQARTTEDMIYQAYTIRLTPGKAKLSRDDFMKNLNEHDIATRLYYPTLHNQGVFKSSQSDAEFPNAITYRETAVSIPIYAGMTDEEQEYVIRHVREALQ